MIHFSGSKLDKSDMKILRLAAKSTLTKFITPYAQRKIFVTIDLEDEYETKGYGDCMHMGLIDDVRHFRVTINTKKMNNRAKKWEIRLKPLIETIIHEMIHVKQYAKGELFDYVNGDSRYRGERLKPAESIEEYFDSPYEIEAYGRTEGIYRMFVACMKNSKMEY